MPEYMTISELIAKLAEIRAKYGNEIAICADGAGPIVDFRFRDCATADFPARHVELISDQD